MKNTTTLRSVVETPDANGPQGGVNHKLEQLLAEPASAAPKPRKRGKLAPATAALPDDLVEVQERFTNYPTNPQNRSFAGEEDLVPLCPRTGLLMLQRTRMLASGEEETYFPCTVDDLPLIVDPDTGATRQYRTVQWWPEVLLFVDERYDSNAEYLWKNSLQEYGQLADGLHVLETSAEYLNEGKEPAKGGGKGGGSGKGGGDKGGGAKPPYWFNIAATPVRLVSLVNDERGNLSLELSYYKIDAIQSYWKTVMIPWGQIHSDGKSDVWKNLQDHGLVLGEDKKSAAKFRQMATDYYRRVSKNPAKYIQTGRSTPGWSHVLIDGVETSVYVAPGFTTHSQIRYTGPDTMAWSKSGDEAAYLRRMAHMLRVNPVVALVCGFTASGILASEFPEIDHCPMWSLLGESSIGKSLAAQTAASMRGNHRALVKNMDATAIALKARMQAFNHCGGAIDEIGSGDRMDKQEKIKTIYQWGSGDVRSRMKYDGTSNSFNVDSKDTCRYTLLLTGEEAFVDITSVPGGNQVRLAQIVFTKDKPLWHSIGNNQDAEAWRGFIDKNFGHLYPKMVHLVARELPRYKEAYKRHYDVLIANIEDSKERRKANAWALALTGVTLLADVLHLVEDEQQEDANEEPRMVAGFDHKDALVVRQHALALLTSELDTAPIQKESEKYMDFLEGLPTFYFADLLTDNIEHLRGSPLGSYSTCDVQDPTNKSGKLKQHTLSIITSHFDRMCGGKIDKTRLLRWAQENDILQTSKEANGVDAKGNAKTVIRQTSKVKIMPSGRSTCYVFVWTEEITKEIDFNT